MDSTNTEDIEEFMEESLKEKCEGLMIKSLDVNAIYDIGKRSHKWLKLKKDYLNRIVMKMVLVLITGLKPVKVWEIKCADLSLSPIYKAAVGLVDPEKGISLRFPRFVRIRDDKNPKEITNAVQVGDEFTDIVNIETNHLSEYNKKTNMEEIYDRGANNE
ncbi:DNA ligase 1-like [Penaeus chinensis]|uniref:DNA ligase 1-like n=1 Tax=Penaeus chinensis TaxID=139456 RepID=UPI001FB7E09C|nr:DNA ligase 1-like [Penaeus chinensis]